MISKTFKNYLKISEDNVNHLWICSYWEDITACIGKISESRVDFFPGIDSASPGIASWGFWSSMPDRRYKTRVARWTRYLVSSFLFSVKQCENHKINRNQERSRKVMKGHHTGHTAIQILWPMLTSCWLLRPHHLALLKGHSRLWRSSSIGFCEPCARNPCKPRQTGSR